MRSAALARIDTVGAPKLRQVYPRWLILHRRSGLEHVTTGRQQYAHAALALAIEEGFGARLLDESFDFPTMADCEFVELIEDVESDAERVDASLGRIA